MDSLEYLILITLYHSISVRNPEGRIRLYCKGADTVLLERLHPCNQELMNITSDHLNVSKHKSGQLSYGFGCGWSCTAI